MNCRKQKVVLNGQHLPWTGVKASVAKGSILVSLLFLSYINNLPNVLSSNAKLFADDTSLLSVGHNITDSSNLLKGDISIMMNGLYNRKWVSILIIKNKLKRTFSVAKPQRQIIQVLCLIITQLIWLRLISI